MINDLHKIASCMYQTRMDIERVVKVLTKNEVSIKDISVIMPFRIQLNLKSHEESFLSIGGELDQLEDITPLEIPHIGRFFGAGPLVEEMVHPETLQSSEGFYKTYDLDDLFYKLNINHLASQKYKEHLRNHLMLLFVNVRTVGCLKIVKELLIENGANDIFVNDLLKVPKQERSALANYFDGFFP